MPTPARPQVAKSSDELFTSLDELTNPQYNYEKQQPLAFGDYTGSVRGGVTIIETKQIDYYDITVLAATDAYSLYNWLEDNGYNFPSQARYILNDYVNNQWYFTAIKINAEYLTDNINQALKTGHAIPLRLTFTTGKMVYPLKISSVDVTYYQRAERRYGPASDAPLGEVRLDQEGNRWQKEADGVWQKLDGYPSTTRYGDVMVDKFPGGTKYVYPSPPVTVDRVNILLYIFANHRQELAGFDTQYAGWLKKDTIQDLAVGANGEPWIKPAKDRYYLTRLYKSTTKAEMSYDLYPRQTKTDDTVNAPAEVERSNFNLVILFLIAGFVTLVAVGALVGLTISKK